MTDDARVEAAARAACRAAYSGVDYDQTSEDTKESWRNVVRAALAAADRVAGEDEPMRDALQQIETWSRAYPLKVFPEPDFAKAAEVLKAAGMTLDAISASNMRHVVEGVGRIARVALAASGDRTAVPHDQREPESTISGMRDLQKAQSRAKELAATLQSGNCIEISEPSYDRAVVITALNALSVSSGKGEGWREINLTPEQHEAGAWQIHHELGTTITAARRAMALAVAAFNEPLLHEPAPPSTLEQKIP